MKSDKIILKAMLVLSIIGAVIALYQTYEHYFLASSVCDFTASFSCSVVTESRFGEFPPSSGIATSAYGVVWWSVLIALVYGVIKGKRLFKNQEFYILLWLIIGALFAAYLIIVELYILPQETGVIVICPLCTVQHVFIAILLVMGFVVLKKPVKTYLENIFFTES